MARPEGLEPPTYGFEARRSIQLSYGRTAVESITSTSRSPWSRAPPLSAAAGRSGRLVSSPFPRSARTPGADLERRVEDGPNRHHAAEPVVAKRLQPDRRHAAALRAVRIAAVLARRDRAASGPTTRTRWSSRRCTRRDSAAGGGSRAGPTAACPSSFGSRSIQRRDLGDHALAILADAASPPTRSPFCGVYRLNQMRLARPAACAQNSVNSVTYPGRDCCRVIVQCTVTCWPLMCLRMRS